MNLISSFQSRRNDLLLQNGPDTGRMIDRLMDFSGDGPGDGGGGAPAHFSLGRARATVRLATFAPPGGMSGLGATSSKRQLGRSFDSEGTEAELGDRADGPDGQHRGGGTRVAISLNLRDVPPRTTRKQQVAAAGQELGTRASAKRRTSPNPFDIWVEGQYTAFNEDRLHLGNQGHFGIFKVGADVVLSPALLVGVMAQYGQRLGRMRFTGPDALLSGAGWMVGPTAVRLSENVFFLGRAAWGRW